MKVDVTIDISHPRDRVFQAYRDKLPELVSYLPNVRGIQVKERREEGGKILLVNRWQGGGDIPAVARSFISANLLEWDDYATWDPERWTCHWRTVTPSSGG